MTLPNFQPPVPGFPVAQLTINGLAICCFNNGSSNGGAKLWEVAYPRQQGHTLIIAIEALNEQGETINVTPYPIDDSVRSFTISLTGGSEDHFAAYPQGGPAAQNFVRTNPNNDPHDLGWMIDITGPELGHDFIRLLPQSESHVPATLAQLRHAFLYTSAPGDQPVRVSPITANDPLDQGSRELGRTNEEIDGLLLANADGEIVFEFDPLTSFSINPLPYDSSRPLRYKITIINEDDQLSALKGGFVKGDLHLFYDVMAVDGERQDLWARPRPTAPGGATDGDCSPVKGSGGSGQTTLRTLIS
jgi:hypothetical protein